MLKKIEANTCVSFFCCFVCLFYKFALKFSCMFQDNDDDDDDLFSAIKSNVLPKAKTEASESKELFGDDTDIFADVQKEKYEMFPSQVYDDDDGEQFHCCFIY